MLLVLGDDAPVLERVCGALARRGLAHRAVPATHVVADPGNLFQAAFDAGAEGLVLVEPVPRKGADPCPPDDRLLDEALRASNAPGVRLVVLVTPRPEDDAGLKRLRRSGVSYVVLRPAPIYDVVPDGADGALEARTVLVPPDVAAWAADAVPMRALVEAVLQAAAGEIPAGRSVDIVPSAETALDAVLARAGAKPRAAGGVRSTFGRWFGQAVARVDGDRVVLEGAPAPAPAAVAEPDAPVVAPA